MTRSNDEILNAWLRDAHGMESQAEDMLETHAQRLEHYPDLANRIRQHLEETRSQRDRLQTCMDTRGVSTSTLKDMTGKLTAFAGGMIGSMAADEVVKGTIGTYAFEQFEMVCYRSLIAAAHAAGDTDTAAVCEGILTEEEAMANWVWDNVPEVTTAYMAREASGADEPAKR